jgi:cytochrome c'
MRAAGESPIAAPAAHPDCQPMKIAPLAALAATLLVLETQAAAPTGAPAATPVPAMKPAASAAGAHPNLHQMMDKVVRVQTQIIWDVSNNLLDDNGNPKASKLSPTDWNNIASASEKVLAVMTTLASSDHVMAAAPGEKIEGEGNPDAFTAKQVQALLDKNPAAFKAFAKQMAGSMTEINSAAKSKNATKLNDVAGRIDQECEGCHTVYWYPNQKIPQ